MERIHHQTEPTPTTSDARRRELAEAIVNEYALIQQKRSKLSRAQRERVVAVYEEARKVCENGEERVDSGCKN